MTTVTVYPVDAIDPDDGIIITTDGMMIEVDPNLLSRKHLGLNSDFMIVESAKWTINQGDAVSYFPNNTFCPLCYGW